MSRIRVLVANRPRLMRDLITATIADQPDVEVVGEARHDNEIFDLIADTQPDVLILAAETPGMPPGMCERVVERYPNLRVLALDPGKTSRFYWVKQDIYGKAIETSEAGVLNALRGRPYDDTRRVP